MSTFLYRLARVSVRRRVLVLLVWLLAATGVVVAGVTSGGTTTDSFVIPGTESQEVAELLEEEAPELSGGQAHVVLATPGEDLTEPTVMDALAATVERLGAVPGVLAVADPFATGAVSRDGDVAVATVQFQTGPGEVSSATLDGVQSAVGPAESAGVTVDWSGSVYPGYQPPLSRTPEIIGLAVASVILLITLGSLVAAGLPILTALLGVVTSRPRCWPWRASWTCPARRPRSR